MGNKRKTSQGKRREERMLMSEEGEKRGLLQGLNKSQGARVRA